MTVWFLVMLLFVGDHVQMQEYPIEFDTQLECSQAGLDLMIDQRSPLKLFCVEADDALDLSVILRDAFTFGGQGV